MAGISDDLLTSHGLIVGKKVDVHNASVEGVDDEREPEAHHSRSRFLRVFSASSCTVQTPFQFAIITEIIQRNTVISSETLNYRIRRNGSQAEAIFANNLVAVAVDCDL